MKRKSPAPGQGAGKGNPVPEIPSILRLYKPYPVVVGEPLGDLVVVRCPFCGKPHYHTRGGGHRLSHCEGGEILGYDIREADP